MSGQGSGIAVVVTSHNYADYLKECLRSLAGQTLLPEQVVVVDDGSTDDTASVLTRLVGELSPRLAVRVITHPEALGLAASMNEGIRSTTTALVVHVDADDVCRPRYLEAMRDALVDNPQAAYAYPRMELFGAESGIYRTIPFDAGRLLFEGNYIPNVALLRRAAFDQTDGFRQLPTHLDWDFWLTLLQKGQSGVLVDEVLYEWRRHPGAMTYQPTWTRLVSRASIVWHHRRLALALRRELIPGTWRAIRRRSPGRTAETRTPSGWIEKS